MKFPPLPTFNYGWDILVGFTGFELSKPLVLWVNDLLMAVFFLLAGLEIKRELISGELNTLRKASGPLAAAVGGMIVPAVIFLSIAPEAPDSRGWAIPMATDIAFALGCLRLLGNRVPTAAVAFLTALAVIDDLGAILIIAAFYTGDLQYLPLLLAGGCVLLLLAMNVLGVERPVWYLLAGLPLWLTVLKSGIHATVAGVILGLSVPAGPRNAETAGQPAPSPREASPLSRLEHGLHPWVAFLVIPLFALANAGVPLAGLTLGSLTAPVSLGIVLGLFLGKQAGVLGAMYLMTRTGLASLPAELVWRHIYGLSLLAGIGFTMSLFIGGLAYGESSPLMVQVKVAVLTASVLSASTGVVILWRRQVT